jgi:hypothetical protein
MSHADIIIAQEKEKKTCTPLMLTIVELVRFSSWLLFGFCIFARCVAESCARGKARATKKRVRTKNNRNRNNHKQTVVV